MVIPSESGAFYLEFVEAEQEIYDPYISLSDGEGGAGEQTVIVGGQEHRLPGRAFIKRAQAQTAVSDFLASGTRSNAINWARRSQIDWSGSE